MDWSLAVGVDLVSAAILVTAMNTVLGNTEAKLAIQTAAVRVDAPDGWQVVTNGLTVIGPTGGANGGVTVSSYTAGKMWVRWGIAFAMAGGATAPGSADVMLAVATVSKGLAVGTWRGPLASTSNVPAVVAVSGWVPAVWAQAVYAGILTQSASGGNSFMSKLMYRTATASQDAPSAWQVTTDTGPGTGGNGERVAFDTGLSLGTNLWVQFGLGYWSASGIASADVAVSVAVRRT